MTTFIILLVLIGFAAAYYFLKPTYDDSWKKELDGFELDRENVEKAKKFLQENSKAPIDFLANFTTKQGRENLSIKERWFTYVIVAIIALLAGLGFYEIAIAIAVLIHLFKKLKSKKLENDGKKSVETTEEVDETEEDTDKVNEDPKWLYYKVRNYVKDLFARVKDEKGELIIEEYIGLLVVSTLPFSLAQFLIPQYNAGWLMVGLVLLTLVGVYAAELLTGFKFTKLGDLKDIKKILKQHQEKIAKLEAEKATLEADILDINVDGAAKEVKKALKKVQEIINK